MSRPLISQLQTARNPQDHVDLRASARVMELADGQGGCSLWHSREHTISHPGMSRLNPAHLGQQGDLAEHKAADMRGYVIHGAQPMPA